MGIKVLKCTGEQSAKLCKGLGVSNAQELLAIKRVPDDDIEYFERLVITGGEEMTDCKEGRGSPGTRFTTHQA